MITQKMKYALKALLTLADEAAKDQPQALTIEEIITEREHEVRRSRYKRIVLSMSTKARSFWTGVRRRMTDLAKQGVRGFRIYTGS